MSVLRIAVDVMGGDFGEKATIPAVLTLANQYPDIQFQLYGDSAVHAESIHAFPDNILFVLAEDNVSMSDSPVYALRHKRQSSMAKIIQAVANGEADGCISAGNTGALMAMGLHYLKTYKGIDRPALCQALPTAKTPSYMVDLGANVDCSPAQLQQFAYLGVALCSVLNKHIESPSVRLLNVGSEALKGSALIQETAECLQQTKTLNYQGFIEGNEIYQGIADVIVCDGFAGNVALKASEGVARFVTNSFKKICHRTVYTRLMALLSKPMLRRWQAEMNPDRYNGAYLLGLQGTVVKSHGAANQQQFTYALDMLVQQLQKQNICSMDTSLKAVMTS